MINAQQNHTCNARTTAASRCSCRNLLSRTTSWEEGASPPAPPAPLTSSKESAKARAAAHERMFDQRRNQATSTLACKMLGPEPSQLPEPARSALSRRPTTANLAGKDDQPSTSPCTRKFRVSPFLSSVCGPDGNAITIGCAFPLQCHPDARLKQELCPWPTGPHQTVTAHLPQTTAIEVVERSEIPHEHVHRHACASLPANPGDGALDSEPTPPQHPCNRAS